MTTSFIQQKIAEKHRNAITFTSLIIVAYFIVVGIYHQQIPEWWSSSTINMLLCIAMSVLALLALVGLIVDLVQLFNPSLHPVYKNLSRYGSPARVIREIDEEIRQSQRKVQDLYLTNNWVICSPTFSLTINKLTDVIWIYKVQTQHRTNMIKTYKEFALMLHTRDGKETKLGTMDEGKIDVMLRELTKTCPWAISGYSSDMASNWQRNYRAVVASVDTRLKSMSGNG